MSGERIDNLNSQQHQAATFGSGALLVIAGAGSGKTTTLASRVAHLCQNGISPERILLLTFTRRAASVMLRRAEELTGTTEVRSVWGGTFHGTANRLLRIYGQAVGVPPEFTILDQSDASDLLHLIRHDLGYDKAKKRFPKKQTLLEIYSHTVNAQSSLGGVLERYFPWCSHAKDEIAKVFEAYTHRKAAHHVLDFDDLLLFWNALVETPTTGDAVGAIFDHILVDEYQDTNAVQSSILRGMRRQIRNIMAVGDDAQSIYAFRAATVRNMLDFPKHFPNATTLTLVQNYRSTPQILDASNAVMEQASERYAKDLVTQRPSGQRPILMTCRDVPHECEAICDQILEHREQGIALMDQAVLFRAGQNSAELEVELTRRKIPFHKYGGLKFVESAHIKDVLVFLRILENPYDAVSWFRLLQLLPGIGSRTAARVMREMGIVVTDRTVQSIQTSSVTRHPLALLRDNPPSVPALSKEEFDRVRKALIECIGLGSAVNDDSGEEATSQGSVGLQIECVRDAYDPICRRVYDQSEIRLRDVEQLATIAARYQSRKRFVADMTLDPPVSTSDLAGPPELDEDYLILSTIHSAKGCEWDVVYILHVSDGVIPSDMSTRDAEGVDEERRLLYVAMTRAKDYLYLYFPFRYYHTKHRMGDAHSYAQLSRFITKDVRALMDVEGGISVGDDAQETTPQGNADAVRDRLRKLWQS